jgi:nucleotide-binding universal stress UspA family protein
MYAKILVPIDGSETSQRALTEATKLASLCGAQMKLLHIVDPLTHTSGFETPEVYLSDCLPSMMSAGEKLLGRAKAETAANGLRVETELQTTRGARVAEIIVEQAKSWGADLIVLGTHGRRGIDRVLLGSDAERVARTSPVPVLLVRPGAERSHA